MKPLAHRGRQIGKAVVMLGLLNVVAAQSVPSPLSTLPPRPEVHAPLVRDIFPANREGRRARSKSIKA